eukprot:1153631-Pelagomonas_calceolata.AAC.1
MPDAVSRKGTALVRSKRSDRMALDSVVFLRQCTLRGKRERDILGGLSWKCLAGSTPIDQDLIRHHTEVFLDMLTGLAGKNMEKLVSWFASPDNKALIDRLAQAGVACVEGPVTDSTAAAAAAAAAGDDATALVDKAIPLQASGADAAAPACGPLSGETIVITGVCCKLWAKGCLGYTLGPGLVLSVLLCSGLAGKGLQERLRAHDHLSMPALQLALAEVMSCLRTPSGCTWELVMLGSRGKNLNTIKRLHRLHNSVYDDHVMLAYFLGLYAGTCEAGTRQQVADVLRSWGAEVEQRMSSRTTMMHSLWESEGLQEHWSSDGNGSS